MELKLKYSHSFSDSIPIEIDRDSWRSLPTNIETEIQTNPVYSLMLKNFKTTLEKGVSETEAQIKTLGYETIRFKLKNLTGTLIPDKKESSTDLLSVQSNKMNELKKNPLSQNKYQEKLIPQNQNQVAEKMSTNLNIAIEAEAPTEPIVLAINSDDIDTNLSENNHNKSEKFSLKNSLFKWNKKPTKAEEAALKLQERKIYLQELGKKLQNARKMRCLSMQQVHKQTFVPLHYVEAIERGETERLPEDVYLRGFIFRLGNALGFDGITLAAALPSSNSLKGLIPSWSESDQEFGFHLHPAYLYVGYAALIAGTVSGLSWMSQQPSSGVNMVPDTLEPPDSFVKSQKHSETTQTPGLKSTRGSLVVGSDIAPPETFTVIS
ncbi:helix-turn-helix domain-containing protein [Okeania sp.]|uniref:helix-turn-helix domain-containing protein n=1 Tax=Okeania sp. TaxID=3100323 RepID=UPI002B4AE3F6|nr:helix-turn-helix domain-containing protein [Okeania sp.]MEB3343304.1 helix-turn-helix domain-containing protein [Okeania sp.]